MRAELFKRSFKGVTLTLLAGQMTVSGAGCAPLNTSAAKSGSIVSFAPSNTELLYSLGAQDRLVGVCSYCDYPERVSHLTKTGSFVSANLERLALLKPKTVLLVSGQEQLAGMLTHNGYQAIVLKNDSLQDISDNLRQLGKVTAHEREANRVANAFEHCLSELERIVAGAASHPKVFCCVWPDPLLTIGKRSYLTDAITRCGGTSISQSLSQAYPHFSMERLILSNPDLIVLPYEAKGKSFLDKHPWTALKAVKNKKVFFLPDAKHDNLARPTLRITGGLFWLALRLHPELEKPLEEWFKESQLALRAAQPEAKAAIIGTPAR